MLVCRKSSNGAGHDAFETSREVVKRKLGEGGPIFLPRRRPSAFTEKLLSEAGHLTAYDDRWLDGRSSS